MVKVKSNRPNCLDTCYRTDYMSEIRDNEPVFTILDLRDVWHECIVRSSVAVWGIIGPAVQLADIPLPQ